MQENTSSTLIEKWLKGWSLSRGLPLPHKFKSGFKVDVGYEKQKCRYVFPHLNQDFADLARTIVKPWTFLKVCAAPGELEPLLPPWWIVQPQGYMMTCFHRMTKKPVALLTGYKREIETYGSTFHAKIKSGDGSLAADGRVVLVDDIAIYDRIATNGDHRRKGLATVVMSELEKIAISKGFQKNFLVATEEGKGLYTSLGWELYCLYTSVVIPEG